MGRIVATEYATLDAVFEEPGSWPFQFWSDEALTFKSDELLASDAMLLGRVTYQGFAAAWPSMHDEQGFADRMNSLPKYVVSTTLKETTWNNSTLLKGNVVDEVTMLKQQIERDILRGGSGQLVRTLMQHNLIDEYRFMLHPIVLGNGKRLFADGLDTSVLQLASTQAFSSGVVILTYRPAQQAAAQ